MHPPDDARAPAGAPKEQVAAGREDARCRAAAPALPPDVAVERLLLPDGRALQLYSWADAADAGRSP